MTVHLGYDAASPFDTAVLAGVSASYANPAWIGRYLEQIQGTSTGLTIAEVAAIHARGLAICLCYNGATPTDVAGSAAVGRANAAVAVNHARALNTPSGVAIFCDIEAGWAPTVDFLIGWLEGVHNGGFVPGAYLNAQDANHINPVLAALTATGIQPALWSSEPEFNAWHDEALGTWYDFSQTPLGAAHAGLVVVHQYTENNLRGTVDLDIASDAGMAVLWRPAPPVPAVIHGRVIVPGVLKAGPAHSSTGVDDPTCPGKAYELPVGTAITYGNGTAKDPVTGELWQRIIVVRPSAAGWFLSKSIAAGV